MHEIDGVPVQVYSAEKTIADRFKYWDKIGLDEALRAYLERKATPDYKMPC